jgi:hypothetical protein
MGGEDRSIPPAINAAPGLRSRRPLTPGRDCASVQLMNLLVQALKLASDDLANAKGIANPRVLSKVNARGEMVIASIIPPRQPGEWASRRRPIEKRSDGRRGREAAGDVSTLAARARTPHGPGQ